MEIQKKLNNFFLNLNIGCSFKITSWSESVVWSHRLTYSSRHIYCLLYKHWQYGTVVFRLKFFICLKKQGFEIIKIKILYLNQLLRVDFFIISTGSVSLVMYPTACLFLPPCATSIDSMILSSRLQIFDISPWCSFKISKLKVFYLNKPLQTLLTDHIFLIISDWNPR